MTNNDILRRVRYIFDINDTSMIKIFDLADMKVDRAQISDWLKNEDDPESKVMNDTELATFLNGFIIKQRGKKDGPQAAVESTLSNNIIFRKLRIALNLQEADIMNILSLADMKISKHELSALFRRTDHKHYRKCKDQILRNFLKGLQLKHRAETPLKSGFEW